MDLSVHLLKECRLNIRESPLRCLYSYWLNRKGNKRFPARRDIDPVEFPYILRDLMLIDVLRSPVRFRVRVHGTERVRRAGYDLTGKLIDEIPTPEYRDYAIQRCVGVVETAEAILVHYARELDGRTYRYEAMWLPLSENGTDITQLLCALIYEK